MQIEEDRLVALAGIAHEFGEALKPTIMRHSNALMGARRPLWEQVSPDPRLRIEGIPTWSWASMVSDEKGANHDTVRKGVNVQWATPPAENHAHAPCPFVLVTAIEVKRIAAADRESWKPHFLSTEPSYLPTNQSNNDNRFAILEVSGLVLQVNLRGPFESSEDADFAADLPGYNPDFGRDLWRKVALYSNRTTIVGWASVEHPDYYPNQPCDCDIFALLTTRLELMNGGYGFGSLSVFHFAFTVLSLKKTVIPGRDSYYERLGIGAYLGTRQIVSFKVQRQQHYIDSQQTSSIIHHALISFPLLDLPGKLRDAIYQQYVIVEGGYVYEFKRGKLRAANDPEHPIDLALMYTCRQIAREMMSMALSANTITFRTLSSPELSLRARHFHGIMRTLIGAAGRPLELCDQCVLGEVARGFPECQPLLQLARVVGQEESPSLTDQDRKDILFLKLRDTRDESIFDEDCWKEPPPPQGALIYAPNSTRNILELVSKFMPWAILIPDEINYAIRKFDKERWTENKTRKGKICPFSAAAVAFKFLHDTPMSTCKHIRKIFVHEDRESVASPQCHAEDFIPFCLENSFLRIERRVNLWRAVVVGFEYIDSTLGKQYENIHWSAEVGTWVAEAMDLRRAGMPRNRFLLPLMAIRAPNMLLNYSREFKSMRRGKKLLMRRARAVYFRYHLWARKE
ncbi:hypothetical protein F5Y01DRAFT_325850 [Xylaria sp. FL0043]|nr:hypothetical protein F5Y01DRAFT_325850 [Xylaria sp. FL0043]